MRPYGNSYSKILNTFHVDRTEGDLVDLDYEDYH